MTKPVLLDIQPDNTAILTFNRPEARNALNLAAMRQFADAVDTLVRHPTLRAVILTGADETAFCSGGDLVELSRYPTETDALDFITVMGDALLKLERLPVPVIAAINGYALGGGSEIALACDLRIVDASVRLGFVQINLALTPGWGAGQRLLRLVGYARAMEILLEGRPMTAEDLLAKGLVNRVVETGQALPAALDFARQIAVLPPDVVRSVKALLQAGLTQPYDQALQTERTIFPPLWAAEAHLKAVEAFLNRKS
jgi:enoyl-CoA hydratase/carnithine racemase